MICRDTFALVTRSTAELASVKQLTLAPKDCSSPVLIPLPAVTKPSDESGDDTKAKFAISILPDDKTTAYSIVAAAGVASSLKGATFLQPDISVPTTLKTDERNLWFSRSAMDAKAGSPFSSSMPEAIPRVRSMSLTRAEGDG